MVVLVCVSRCCFSWEAQEPTEYLIPLQRSRPLAVHYGERDGGDSGDREDGDEAEMMAMKLK